MNEINLQYWNEEKFKQGKAEWTALLEQSDADKLFLSWEWQYTWWEVFSKTNSLKLTLLVAYNNNKLIGIAPLYIIHSVTKNYLKTTQLQFIGNICRGKTTMRTEYIDFIVNRENDLPIKHAFLEHINKNLNWDEFYFTDLKKDSSTYPLLTKMNILSNVYTRVAEEYKSYFLNTSGLFQDYIKQRGKNTRLRMYNRRKILTTEGDIKITNINTDKNTNIDKIDEYFSLLNKLHKNRWGKDVFTDERLIFNAKVAMELAKKNAVNFSILSINATPISIQFNYIINNHEYNIQAGFKENLNKKLALGYLHFGYEIEAAFNSKILIYDFLAGDGKNTNYKERLTESFHDIIQLQIIRKRSLRFLYQTKDFIMKLLYTIKIK